MPDAEADHDAVALPVAQPQADEAPPAVRAPHRGQSDRLRAIIDRANACDLAAAIPDVAASIVVGAVAGVRSGATDFARSAFGLGGLAGSDLAAGLALRADAHADKLDQGFADRHAERPLSDTIRDLTDRALHQAPIVAAERAGGPFASVVTEGALMAGDAYVDARIAGADHGQARHDVVANGLRSIYRELTDRVDPGQASSDR